MTVLLVGGIGKLGAAYVAAAKSLGHELLHAEKRLSSPPRVEAVLVVTSVCSHPLLTAARDHAAACGCAIHYLPRPSLSTLRRVLSEEVCHVQ